MSVRSRLKANPVAYSVLLAALATPAHADDLVISGANTAPVATSQASNGTPGNVTVLQNATLTVSVATAAVTIDSDNSLLNQGIIQDTFESNAVLIHIEAGHTGNVTNSADFQGRLNIVGQGTGNYGILLDGAGVFTGNIDLQAGQTTFVVNGDHAFAVAINSGLVGNLSIGNLNTFGAGTTGIQTTAPVSGAISVTGQVVVAGTLNYTNTDVDPLTGSALAVGANVGGGILIAGPATLTDLAVPAGISNSGTAPTIAISASIGANTSDIVVSPLAADATSPTFSFINRGVVNAAENDPGVSTVALLVGETGTATHTTTLSGGILNRGNIVASAETDNLHAINGTAASSDATAVEIGNGGIVSTGASGFAFLNEGNITASVGGNLSTTATGIIVASGGTLPNFTNTGAISVLATSTDTVNSSLAAYGVRDLSGTLTHLTNQGSITARASVLQNDAQVTVAIDLSHGSDETIVNTGIIAGDVLLGSGNSTLSMDHANASIGGSLLFTGGTLDVQISQTGLGGKLATENGHATTLGVGGNGTLQFAITNRTSTTTPIMRVDGNADFKAGSHVVVVPTTFLPTSASFTLVGAGGTLSFDDFSSTTANPIPFLYNGNITHDSHDLTLTLTRKTAAQLGLTGNAAAIYEPLAAAAQSEDVYGAALLSLGTISTVNSALDATVPDVAGGIRALAVAMTDQATGVIGARQRTIVTAPPNTRDDFRFWSQEVYNIVSRDSTAASGGFNGAGLGASVGVEWGARETVRYGLGASFYSSQEVERHPRDTKTDADWLLASAYATWRQDNFFIAPQASAGYGTFKSRRSIIAASYFASSRADWSGLLGAGGLTTGYVLDLGFLQIIPQLAIDGLYVYESGYSESGANGLGLAMDSQSQKSVRGFAGVMAQSSFMWNDGNVLPQLLAGYSREFMTSPATIDGSFEAAPGSPFHLVGPTVDTNRIIGGASVAYVFGNWSAGLNYDAAESERSFAQSATVSISSRF